jgi:hypothetical protein
LFTAFNELGSIEHEAYVHIVNKKIRDISDIVENKLPLLSKNFLNHYEKINSESGS